MKRHSIDLVALLFGLAFAGTGAAFLVHELSDRRVDGAWAAAIGLVALGVVALAATILRPAQPDDDVVTDSPEGHETT